MAQVTAEQHRIRLQRSSVLRIRCKPIGGSIQVQKAVKRRQKWNSSR
ncbi:hypothetical protein HY640_02580 [Candidatus Woesearchaeota archaeon]|nr:hypothetical protein [Candidatus Woesearchaeota archaeon]